MERKVTDMALAGNRKDIEKKLCALAGDGFNADFEELVVDKISRLMQAGMSKRLLLDFLDLAIEAKVKPRQKANG